MACLLTSRRLFHSGDAYGNLWRFDPSAKVWTNLSSIPNAPSARWAVDLASWNGLVFLFGGWNSGALFHHDDANHCDVNATITIRTASNECSYCLQVGCLWQIFNASIQ